MQSNQRRISHLGGQEVAESVLAIGIELPESRISRGVVSALIGGCFLSSSVVRVRFRGHERYPQDEFAAHAGQLICH